MGLGKRLSRWEIGILFGVCHLLRGSTIGGSTVVPNIGGGGGGGELPPSMLCTQSPTPTPIKNTLVVYKSYHCRGM